MCVEALWQSLENRLWCPLNGVWVLAPLILTSFEKTLD